MKPLSVEMACLLGIQNEVYKQCVMCMSVNRLSEKFLKNTSGLLLNSFKNSNMEKQIVPPKLTLYLFRISGIGKNCSTFKNHLYLDTNPLLKRRLCFHR